MSIAELLGNIWANLRGAGSGTDYVTVYDALGAILWAFILFKVFLQEGLQVASGAETSLPRIFVKYVFVAGMFAVWPQAATAVFDAVIQPGRALLSRSQPIASRHEHPDAGHVGERSCSRKYTRFSGKHSRHHLQLHHRQSPHPHWNAHPVPLLRPGARQHRRFDHGPCLESFARPGVLCASL